MRNSAVRSVSRTAATLILAIVIAVAGVGVALYYATLPAPVVVTTRTETLPGTTVVRTETFMPTVTEEKKLAIYHWWTAGGEREAIDAMYEVYKKMYPGVEIIDNPAAGGGGAVMRAAVKAMLMAGQPPDTFQITYGPGMIASWSIYLEPIDELFEDFPIPEELASWSKVGDHYYAMPLNIHRDSNVWYNIKLVDELGLEMPLKTVDDFFAACEVAKTRGYIPFSFGTVGGQRFWLNYIFEWFVLASPNGGADYLNDFNAGRANPATDPAVRDALENFKKLWQDYVNPDFGALTWDEAGKVLMRDEAVFHLMGDWQKGHFMASGWVPDVDFGWMPAPGTEGSAIVHGDSFGLAKGAPHPTAAWKFCEALKSAEGEEAFCVIKGASPPRKDVPLDRFDVMQRRIIDSVRSDKLVVGGHGVVEAWLDVGGEIFEGFTVDFDVDKTIADIDAAYKEIYS